MLITIDHKEILDMMTDGITVQDLDFNIIFQNRMMLEAFGDRLGEKCYAAYERRDRICEECGVRKAFQTGKPNIVLRTGVMISGQPTSWENACIPLFDKEGRLFAGMEVCRNVTSRVSLEQGVRERNIQLGRLNDQLERRTAELQEALRQREAMAENLEQEMEQRAQREKEISERKRAEEELARNLWFFESMDRINRVVQGADSLEQLMTNVLDTMLSIFGCDRAFLAVPCDPEAPEFTIAMERTAAQYPGAFDRAVTVPMSPAVKGLFNILLGNPAPFEIYIGNGLDPEDVVWKTYQIKSQLAVVLYPRIGSPWECGLHQCSYNRVWTPQEKKLFQEISRRLGDMLTSLLSYRNLKESEERYRRIVDTANEGIWTLGPDMLTAFVNTRMAEMLGYGVHEMLGRPLTDFMFEEDVPDYQQRMKTRREGIAEHYERRFRRKDGRTVWTLVSATPILDRNQRFQGAFGMHTDITKRKRAEEALNRANDELEDRVKERTRALEQANDELRGMSRKLEEAYNELKSAQSRILQQEKMASVGQLAAGVAHEINNPIGFIISNLNSFGKYMDKINEFIAAQAAAVETLARQEGTGAIAAEVRRQRRDAKIDLLLPDISNLISESLEGAERVRRIVQDLKGFSRLGEAEFKMADVNKGLESTINIVWNELKYKARLTKEFGELPLTKCNLGQLNQVFMNILINAGQAIETRGEINVKTWSDNGMIYVSISDTGAGIPPEIQARIFEPFFTTKDVGKGTGLGLSIAYDIIKNHKGDMQVKSAVGKGTTISISLPVAAE